MTHMTRLTGVALALLLGAGCGGGDEPELPGHAYNFIGIPGEEGFNGDGHDRLDTRLYWSFDMLFASNGTTYFIDWNNHIIRKLLEDDTVQTVVGSTDPILPGDGESTGAEYTAEGAPGTDIRLNHPTELIEAPDGTIYLMAWHNHKLRTIDPATERVKIVAGAGAGFRGDGGPMADALFKQPNSVEMGDDGTLYIADQQNFRVRAISPDGIIDTIAGNGVGNLQGDPGADQIAALDSPIDWEAGSNPEPSGGLAFKDNKLYFSETLRNRIRVIDLETGMIDTVAGTPEPGYVDGDAASAQFNHPEQMDFGPDGDLYVADTNNCTIRAIDLANGEVRTVVGTGTLGLDPEDGLEATSTLLRRPFGLEFDPEGNLYVMDTINSRILRVPR